MNHDSTANVMTESDLALFRQGGHCRLYDLLGAHPAQREGTDGVHFAVWAPHAEQVAVVGDFNGWNEAVHPLERLGDSGIWAGFVPYIGPGTGYLYRVQSGSGSFRADKADPFGFFHRTPPETPSVVWDLSFGWNDQEWMETRERRSADGPLTVYEVHLGSWMRVPEEGNRFLTYRELAPKLAAYAREMNYTHIEILPITEHPFYGSWGYQATGYFAPTGRYGTPEDFMYLVDLLHREGIGLILDWVPGHFPRDEHGLGRFDGSPLYEPSDSNRAVHPEWDDYVFDYGRGEVASFLLSSGLFWLDVYHIDGLRVDGVASMLSLHASQGQKENPEAIKFLRRFNEEAYTRFPTAVTIAEESDAWPLVSRPTYEGGLGFGMKWDMGWMHDTLEYLANDPLYRSFHQQKLTFRLMYAFKENYVLSLSHDEVSRGKSSLLNRMVGDDWQKFANLRLLYGYMYGQPGKKLLFMGGDFGQRDGWNHEQSLDWHLLAEEPHAGMSRWVTNLNRVYRAEPSLHDLDFSADGFEWIDCNDTEKSVLSFLRKGKSGREIMVVVCNFTPVVRHNYRVGVPFDGVYREILNSDAAEFGGSGQGNLGGVEAAPVGFHGRFHSLNLTLPPLGVLFLKWEGEAHV